MRIDTLIRLAALTLGSSLSLASAQPAPTAATGAAAPMAVAETTGPASFGDDWTGQPQSLADAQREARAAAGEALKACRRQGGDVERCLTPTRRDNQMALQKASRAPARAAGRTNRQGR